MALSTLGCFYTFYSSIIEYCLILPAMICMISLDTTHLSYEIALVLELNMASIAAY